MRVLLTSWGSAGDFYPFLALGKSLQLRGHAVTLVGNPGWGERSRAAGLDFRAAFEEAEEDVLRRHPEMIDNRWMGLTSLYHMMNKGIVPVLPSTFRVLLEEAARHDLLVAHHFVFPAGMVHEKTRIPWVTVCLAPGVTPSAWSQPAASWRPAPTSPVERWAMKIGWDIGARLIRPIVDPPLNAFRRSLQLPTLVDHFFQGRSQDLVLHLYSEHFAAKPPDWDGHHFLTGFCHTNFGRDYQPPAELAEFLSSGPKPLLFTLGSTVVEHPRDFFTEAVEAVRSTAHRAILLIGREHHRPEALPANVLALPQVPHDWLMPRCRAAAHQCGIGTAAEALRAGIPSVGCPHAFDQPNNATRLQELGVAVVLKPHQHQASVLRAAFERLLASEAPGRARQIAELLQQEDGSTHASMALEQFHLSKSCP
jgi:UDP:flavonoid glycosyltransferase YjiC (YdhE family)